MLEFLALFQAEAFHDFGHPISGTKVPHQIVFEGDIKSRRSRVTLPCAPTSQLAVDTPRLVSLRAEHVEPAAVRHFRSELNVRSAASHVRGNSDGAGLSCSGDDLGLLHVKFR